jgi:sulfite reductase alpha subunit-like flavoprotein
MRFLHLLTRCRSLAGTAEGFSKTLAEQGRRVGFSARVVDLDVFDPSALASQSLALFLIATYGEGEPTDNSAKFWKWLSNPVRVCFLLVGGPDFCRFAADASHIIS